MLKFLTQKLRTHSLNEENVSEKVGVASDRLRGVKVTAPPENGRLAREQRSGTFVDRPAAIFVVCRIGDSAVLSWMNVRCFHVVVVPKLSTATGRTTIAGGAGATATGCLSRCLCVAGGGARLRHRIGRRGGPRWLRWVPARLNTLQINSAPRRNATLTKPRYRFSKRNRDTPVAGRLTYIC